MLKLTLVSIFLAVVFCYEDLPVYKQLDEDLQVLREALSNQKLLRLRRQLFGGRSNYPGGGFRQEVGYSGSVFNTPKKDVSAWGSLSQSGTPSRSGPINYGGGVDYRTSSGSGLSFSGLHVPKQGSQGTLSGTLNLRNTPDHNLNAFASHTKTFDPHFKEVGRGSSSAGFNYQHSSGAQGSITGYHTPGQPKSGTIGGSVPLYNKGGTSIDVKGQSTFTQGLKPNHEVGISLTKQF